MDMEGLIVDNCGNCRYYRKGCCYYLSPYERDNEDPPTVYTFDICHLFKPDSSNTEPTVKENLVEKLPISSHPRTPIKIKATYKGKGSVSLASLDDEEPTSAKNAQVEKPTREQIYRKALDKTIEIICKSKSLHKAEQAYLTLKEAIKEAEKL